LTKDLEEKVQSQKINLAQKKEIVEQLKNKNTFEILSIPIVVNEKHVEFINYLFDWMRRVKKAFDEKQLPERGYRKDSKICKSCPLEKVCDSKDKGVIKIERRKELE
jgi:CRISPR/Cas system-associated exonuclease Cas4 (RecB family)